MVPQIRWNVSPRIFVPTSNRIWQHVVTNFTDTYGQCVVSYGSSSIVYLFVSSPASSRSFVCLFFVFTSVAFRYFTFVACFVFLRIFILHGQTRAEISTQILIKYDLFHSVLRIKVDSSHLFWKKVMNCGL